MIVEAWEWVVAFITVFSLALFFVSFTSWRRSGQTRILLVSTGFGLFAVKGLLLSLSLFYPTDLSLTLLATGTADAIILCLLFVASVRNS